MRLKTISGTHSKRASFPGFRETAALFVLNYWLREFPLSTIENVFEFGCQQKQQMLQCRGEIDDQMPGLREFLCANACGCPGVVMVKEGIERDIIRTIAI